MKCVYLPFLGIVSSEADGSAGEQIKKDIEQQEEAAEFHQDKLWLKACCCYIRTRCNKYLVFSY